MKNKKPQVLVSHSGRQHVHQLCYALQANKFPYWLTTSIWYKPEALYYKVLNFLPAALHKRVLNNLRKRYFEQLDTNNIYLFPISEVCRQILQKLSSVKDERWIFMAERMHDWYTFRFLAKHIPDIVVGYEKSSYKTFKLAKELKKITILDLAAVHYTQNIFLRKQYHDFEMMMPDEKLFCRINALKEKEYQYVDYFFVLSDYAKRTLLNANIDASKIYTLNIGFDPQKFSLKQAYSPNKTFEILLVGRISKLKGIRLLCKAFKELALVNAKLIFVGPMDDGEDVLREYKGYYEHVAFVDQQQLVKYYQRADVFVMPSYTDSWGMVVLEAMACGTPVIISENTGSRDAVEKGGGFIIPVDDIDALKSKLSFFYMNRAQIEIMGREANKVAQAYTWDNYYTQVVNAIEDIWHREHCKMQQFEAAF